MPTVEHHGPRHPEFLKSLAPVTAASDAPPLFRTMIEAAEAAGVGPMAAVAGAVAQAVGRFLVEESPQVIVENGGDIFPASREDRLVSIYAGDSPFSQDWISGWGLRRPPSGFAHHRARWDIP